MKWWVGDDSCSPESRRRHRVHARCVLHGATVELLEVFPNKHGLKLHDEL
jgi:hypothetical protein